MQKLKKKKKKNGQSAKIIGVQKHWFNLFIHIDIRKIILFNNYLNFNKILYSLVSIWLFPRSEPDYSESDFGKLFIKKLIYEMQCIRETMPVVH